LRGFKKNKSVNSKQYPMNILRFFESFRTCETERAPKARQNNGFFP